MPPHTLYYAVCLFKCKTTCLSVSGAYEPLKAEKERPTTHHSTYRFNLNHLTHLPEKERDVYLARKLQR